MREKLEKFIKDNGIVFSIGKRNFDSVTISGYALSIGITECSQLEKIIDEILPDAETKSGYKEISNISALIFLFFRAII